MDDYGLTILVELDREMERFPTRPHRLFDDAWCLDRLEVLEGCLIATWSEEAVAGIVVESYGPGAKICDVVRRHGMASQHLPTWRGLAKKGQLVPLMPNDGKHLFAPMEVLADPALPPVEPASSGMIEIKAGGATIRVLLNTVTAHLAELALALQAH